MLAFFINVNILWAQDKEAVPISQEEAAKLIGEELGYMADYMVNLKKIGITPLGEWEPEKPLTKDDLDAILIRMARRSPVVENQEPAKILDSMRFPARDVSLNGIKKILANDAFKKTTINSKLILCQAILPLPPAYQAIAALERGIEIGAPLPAAVIAVTPTGGEDGGGNGDGDGDGDEDGDGDKPPPDIYTP